MMPPSCVTISHSFVWHNVSDINSSKMSQQMSWRIHSKWGLFYAFFTTFHIIYWRSLVRNSFADHIHLNTRPIRWLKKWLYFVDWFFSTIVWCFKFKYHYLWISIFVLFNLWRNRWILQYWYSNSKAYSKTKRIQPSTVTIFLLSTKA